MAHSAPTAYHLCDCEGEKLRLYEGCGATHYLQRAHCCPILLAEQARDRAVEASRRQGTRPTRNADTLARRAAAAQAAHAAQQVYDNTVAHYAQHGTQCSLAGEATDWVERRPEECRGFVSDCAHAPCVANRIANYRFA